MGGLIVREVRREQWRERAYDSLGLKRSGFGSGNKKVCFDFSLSSYGKQKERKRERERERERRTERSGVREEKQKGKNGEEQRHS